MLEAVAGARGPLEPAALQAATELSETKLATALVAAGGGRRGRGAARRRGGAGGGDPPPRTAAIEAAAARGGAPARVRPLARGHDARATPRPTAAGARSSSPTSASRSTPPCGNCDNCLAGRRRRGAATTCRSRSARASRHDDWGEGVVQRYDDAARRRAVRRRRLQDAGARRGARARAAARRLTHQVPSALQSPRSGERAGARDACRRRVRVDA